MESNRGDERCGRHTQRAHHMRRGQQPGMHRTPHTTHDTHSNPRQQAHTHSPAATQTHRWRREKQTGAAHKAPPHAHTARAVRRVGTPHGGYAQTKEEVQRTQQHKSKVTKKEDRRTPREMLVHGKCSQYSSQKQFSCLLAFVHIQRTPLHARPGTAAAAAHAKTSARNGIMQAIIYLRFCLDFGRCLHALFLFLQRASLHAWVVCWGFLQGAQFFYFSPCGCFLC
ncbi:hypothetical protein ECC02_013153 [Trypanosoma cruzi]|uniref:Uncharacterized protein n=1 Tax=Trypanosoma cruzi TaxID=5693 RepID=A0A7J6XJ44_TRYCR|nr:hypothetical protein ECC02_013153 [Trypanosoma cruzi]